MPRRQGLSAVQTLQSVGEQCVDPGAEYIVQRVGRRMVERGNEVSIVSKYLTLHSATTTTSKKMTKKSTTYKSGTFIACSCASQYSATIGFVSSVALPLIRHLTWSNLMSSNRSLKLRWLTKAAAAVVVGQFACAAAQAAPSFSIFLGYADGLRGSTNFPSIWQGDPNVIFNGGGSVTANSDTGAIMLRNTGTSVFSITDLVASGFDLGGPFQLWSSFLSGGQTLSPGQNAIFTQTGNYNFDTSDFNNGTQALPSTSQPTVTFSFGDGSSAVCHDTAQVLNTGGFDTATIGNEALGWRLCGTTGIGNPGNQIPEPGTFGLAGLALLGLAGGLRRRRAA